MMDLPRDKDILKRLYAILSDQLKRWDEDRDALRAAFTQLNDRHYDGMPYDECWLLAKQLIPAIPLATLSSELKPFFPMTVRMHIAMIAVGTSAYELILEFRPIAERLNGQQDTDGNFISLLKFGEELQAKILEAMTRWSNRRSPDEWEWVFKILGEEVTWKTITRRNIRKNPSSTSKLISFDMDQLPNGYEDSLTPTKNKTKSP